MKVNMTITFEVDTDDSQVASSRGEGLVAELEANEGTISNIDYSLEIIL